MLYRFRTGLNAALRYNPRSPLLNQRLAILHLYYRDFPKALEHSGTCRESRHIRRVVSRSDPAPLPGQDRLSYLHLHYRYPVDGSTSWRSSK